MGKKKSHNTDIEFVEPIEITNEDIEKFEENYGKKFTLKKEFKNIVDDLKHNKGRNLILLWLSIILLVASLVLGIIYYQKINGGEEIDAIVTDIIETTSGDGKFVEYYQAKLTYEYNGKKYENVEYEDADESLFIGDSIKVRVAPSKPEKIYSNKIYIKLIPVTLATSLFFFIGHFYMAWRKIYFAENDEEDDDDRMIDDKNKA